MSSRRIMLIRHAEKPSLDGTVQGVTADGVPNPGELSVRGWQRAGALVRLFAPLDGVTGTAIRTPDFLFAQGLAQHATSVRAPHTLGSLAALLGKAISTEFSKGQEEQLAGALRALTGPVLVAWERPSTERRRALSAVRSSEEGRRRLQDGRDRTPLLQQGGNGRPVATGPAARPAGAGVRCLSGPCAGRARHLSRRCRSAAARRSRARAPLRQCRR
jgi:hypothetical protein